MYFSIRHWHPLLNGYSGHHPASYSELLETLRLRDFPRQDTIRCLRGLGVKYLVIHSQHLRGLPDLDRYHTVVRRLTDERGVQLQFALRGSDPVAVFILER